MKPIIIAIALIFLLFSTTWAYLEPSFRIKALGEDFVGIIVDEYTDIFRNPAYLALVKNYKIFAEYRKESLGKGQTANRLILGSVLPKFSFGKLAMLGKGWQQKSENLYQIETFYAPSTITTIKGQTSENINNNPTLINSDFIYALTLGPNFNLGANFIYYEDKTESHYRSNEYVIVFNNVSGFKVREFIGMRNENTFRANRFIQISSGVNFPWGQTLSFDLNFSFQHLNSENTNNLMRVIQTNYYDSAGNIYQIYGNADTNFFVAPKQKGDKFGIGFRISKSLNSLERANLLCGFFYTDWNTFANSNQIFYANDSLTNSLQQFFSGNKKDIKAHIKLGIESKKLDNKIKLFAGVTDSLTFERQTYPDFLTSKPQSKWRNSLHRISLPLGLEYYPLNQLTLRYGALPSYTYSRNEGFIPNYFVWNISTSRTTSFNNSFGYSFQPLKNLSVEGYVLQLGNLFSINDWTFSASYNF